MKIEIKYSTLPKMQPRKTKGRWKDCHEAIQEMKPGAWFEVPGSRAFKDDDKKKCRASLASYIARNSLAGAGMAVGISSEGAVVVLRTKEV